MGQILSPSEVESILSALDLEAVQPARPAEAMALPSIEQVSLYDFEHPEPLRRSQLDVLRLAAAAASQSLQTSLSKVLQSSFLVKYLGVEQSTYRDYLATAECPGCIAAFASADAPNLWLLDLSRCLAFTMVDCMLGGQPFESNPVEIAARPFTELETRLIERAVQAVLPDLAGCFTRRTLPRFTRLISDGTLIQEATSNEPVALVSFEILFGNHQGLMQFCIPWKQVVQTSQTASTAGRDFRSDLRSSAVKIPVIATARVATLKLSTRELAGLSAGDVLLTETTPADEMTLEVDGCEIFRGNPGQSQNHKVIRLTVPVAPVVEQ